MLAYYTIPHYLTSSNTFWTSWPKKIIISLDYIYHLMNTNALLLTTYIWSLLTQWHITTNSFLDIIHLPSYDWNLHNSSLLSLPIRENSSLITYQVHDYNNIVWLITISVSYIIDPMHAFLLTLGTFTTSAYNLITRTTFSG